MLRYTAIALLAAVAAPAPKPAPQELFNRGVEKLAGKDLREAEKYLIEAARSNQETVQPLATYNLGHVRFLQGKETLSSEGNRQDLLDSASAARAVADEALRRGHDALIGDEDVRTLVERYNDASAARRQLRKPGKDATRALDLLGTVIKRWRTSADSFHSAFELEPANKDAEFNAEVVERHLAEQLRFQKTLEQQQEGMIARRRELTALMKKLFAQIPDEFKEQVPAEEGEGEEEEEEEGEGQRSPRETEKGRDGEEERDSQERSKGSVPQQRQRLGSDREISPDVLRMLKEKIVPRTMSPGNEPRDAAESGQAGPFGEQPRRKPRDW